MVMVCYKRVWLVTVVILMPFIMVLMLDFIKLIYIDRKFAASQGGKESEEFRKFDIGTLYIYENEKYEDNNNIKHLSDNLNNIDLIEKNREYLKYGYLNILDDMDRNVCSDVIPVSIFKGAGKSIMINKIKDKVTGLICSNIKNVYRSIADEISYFPIVLLNSDNYEMNYKDLWAYNVYLDGCNIVLNDKTDGKYPVISITNGNIIHIGWEEISGYMVEVKSENGNFYKYSHLHSFDSSIKKGDNIKAGQLLGFVGSSGNGEYGTSNKYTTHLNVSIHTNVKNNDISINPYFILKYLEGGVLYYNY
ncbi:MAG: M23 family metallopeptidase [Lachnospiraceae bacterium]|nr:M23 family metallopeptidase [Lachnospiraceae bacterium]